MNNPFRLLLERRDRLSAEEIGIVERISSRVRVVAAKQDLVCEGDRPTESCLMLSGFSARYNLLADGKRQITAVHVAGEFVDLHSLLLARMDHSVTALSDSTVSMVPHEYLRELSATHPHFTRMLWLLTVTDAAMYRQWLVAAGRLSTPGQIAHFLCEMFVRLEIVGQTDGFSFRLPMSQTELSDAMGLSVVHVNRTLQELRKKNFIVWQGEEIRIVDWDVLRKLAEFDPAYLNLELKPR
jgi:CRP-like cAMP-binding protein